MKAKVKNFFNLIAGSILSLLGFSGCDLIYGIVNPVAEYGMPHADYKIVGEVQGDEGPIEGIQVKYRHNMGSYTDENGEEHENWREETLTTDKNGRVDAGLQDYDAWMKQEDLQVVLTDIDGEKNGEYEQMVIEGNDLNVTFKEDKDGRWHTGSYVIGFTARMKAKYEAMPAEYGMPHADYRVIGTVKDAKGHAIPGIEILASLWQVEGDYQHEGAFFRAESGVDGTFAADMTEWPGYNVVKLTLNDIDGEDNGGEFKSAEVSASFTQVKEGSGHWYEGSFEANAGDIVLKK